MNNKRKQLKQDVIDSIAKNMKISIEQATALFNGLSQKKKRKLLQEFQK